jgi:hypothetical protein
LAVQPLEWDIEIIPDEDLVYWRVHVNLLDFFLSVLAAGVAAALAPEGMIGSVLLSVHKILVIVTLVIWILAISRHGNK